MNVQAVLEWAQRRDLIRNGIPGAQIEKVEEEVREFRLAWLYWKFEQHATTDMELELGDILFATILLAYQVGLDPTICLGRAIQKNWNRKGKIVDGIFVKEE